MWCFQDILIEINRRKEENRTAKPNDHGYIRQKTQGKLWVRERIDGFVDPNSFKEVGALAGNAKYNPDGSVKSHAPANFICGRATANGRPVVVGADDFSIRAGHADGAVYGKSVSIFDFLVENEI